MKKFIKSSLMGVLTAALISLLPVIGLYVEGSRGMLSNDASVSKIAGNKGDYFGFIIMGDNHAGLIFNDSATLKLIANINREDRFKKLPMDLVLILGDVSFRGSRWDYRAFNKIRARIKFPVIVAAGNHDDDKDDGTLFRKYAGISQFAFADRNSYFIVLDNSGGDLADGQFEWFEAELAKAAAYRHRFVIAHKCPISPYQQSWYRPEINPWAYRFMKLCEKYKVDIVFSGHEHMFSKKSFGGVKYMVSGGGGNLIQIPDQDGGYLHYAVVRVLGDYVDYEVRKITPPFWELVTYYIWKDLFYLLKGLVL